MPRPTHALFTNEELQDAYDTVEKPRGTDRMQEYLSWIRGTNKTTIDVEPSRHVRDRR